MLFGLSSYLWVGLKCVSCLSFMFRWKFFGVFGLVLIV